MSERLTTPTGCPAALITGAALKPLSLSKAIASWIVASSRMEIGFGRIISDAISTSRLMLALGIAVILVPMTDLLSLELAGGRATSAGTEAPRLPVGYDRCT